MRHAVPEALDQATCDLLERRAERIRSRPADDAEERLLSVADFPVGDERYSISLQALRAIVPLRRVTPVPLAPPHIIGILNFQGQLLTAFSLASLLGIRGWRQDSAVLLVVEQVRGRLVAIDCEEIPQLLMLTAARVDQAWAQATGAVAQLLSEGMQEVKLLDPERLLAPHEEAANAR